MTDKKSRLRVGKTSTQNSEKAQFETAFNKGEDVPMKRLNTNIPADLHMKLKRIALERGQSMTGIVSEWIESL